LPNVEGPNEAAATGGACSGPNESPDSGYSGTGSSDRSAHQISSQLQQYAGRRVSRDDLLLNTWLNKQMRIGALARFALLALPASFPGHAEAQQAIALTCKGDITNTLIGNFNLVDSAKFRFDFATQTVEAPWGKYEITGVGQNFILFGTHTRGLTAEGLLERNDGRLRITWKVPGHEAIGDTFLLADFRCVAHSF
jgi:hypothetical protein